MNEAIQNLLTRRSVRSFVTDKDISREDLQVIVDAARHAPSAMNRQIWKFLVLQGQDKIQGLARAVAKATGAGDSYDFYRPNAFIVCAYEKGAGLGVQDCSCALENIFLAAHALGIGSVWINQLKDTCDDPQVRAQLTQLGLPENTAVVGCAALGYADGPIVPRGPRKPESETVIWNL